MSGSKNVIELNGKLYDVSTGAIVGESQSNAQPAAVKTQSRGTVVDGVIRKSVNHKPVATQKVEVTMHTKSHAPRVPGKHAAAHQPNRSKTLMRRGLKKPQLAAAASTPIVEEQPIIDNPATPAHSPRLERAQKVSQSPKISRFGVAGMAHHQSFVKKSHKPVPVAPAPAHISHHEAIVDQRRASAEKVASSTAEHNKALKEKLVSEAIKQARAPEPHQATHKKHRVAHKLGISHKTLRYSTGALAVILIAGFFAYQNAANISMRIASSKAGFAASSPSYKPSGFSMSGPVEYGPGQITLNFKSNSDQRNFHITQRVSNWNSEALVSNYLASNNKSFQTYQDKGRTIYVYDGSNATWVSGGVWYQIEGNSSLTSEQLLHIASSM